MGWQWSTLWSAVSALATVGAALAAFLYVRLTHALTRATRDQLVMLAKTRETALMQQLMSGYDKRRSSIAYIGQYYLECARQNNTDPLERYRDEMVLKYEGETNDKSAHGLDDERHYVSRFFVRIRKLHRAGYLSEDVIVAALDRSAIEVFLDHVDPLDAAVAGLHYTGDDREFYLDLLRRRYVDDAEDSV